MAVTLEPLSARTWRAVRDLEVDEPQRAFVSPVANYLALARYGEDGWTPLAICADGQVVGHAMWAVDGEDGSAWIGGLVIDRRHQGRGVGRAAMERLVAMLAAAGHRRIALSYEAENAVARGLYASLGFRETGETIEDELIARLDVETT